MNTTKWMKLEITSFKKITDLLKKALTNSAMYGITGPTGCGKTSAFDWFRENFKNVYYIKVEGVWTAKDFYLQILYKIGITDYDRNVSLKSMADRIAYILNDRKEKTLFIFDECGKLSATMLQNFQVIRDSTEDHVGIILAGTKKFEDDFDKWVKKDYIGIPELSSRVTSWYKLEPATRDEKIQIIKANGIHSPKDVKLIVDSSSDLRKLRQNVIDFKYEQSLISQPVPEIK